MNRESPLVKPNLAGGQKRGGEMAKRFFIGFLAIFAFVGSAFLYGQSQAETPAQVAVSELPDAPMPAMESSSDSMPFASAAITSLGKPAQAKKHRWLTTYNGSIATLIMGEAIDTWGTHRNMTHRKWLCGFDPEPGFGYAISTNDQILYSVADVKSICGVSPAGVQPNYMYDVTQADSFIETGWAAKWKLTGNRNYAGVEAWNMGADVAQALVAHYLHKKGGWKGKLGTAMNFSHGIVHLEGGISNLHYASANRTTPDQWVKNNPLWFSNWTPPRWWGKE
jgi:hypothetical protein